MMPGLQDQTNVDKARTSDFMLSLAVEFALLLRLRVILGPVCDTVSGLALGEGEMLSSGLGSLAHQETRAARGLVLFSSSLSSCSREMTTVIEGSTE